MLPLILDGLILLLLAATVFFAARLSLQLKAFSDNRKALRGLITDLSTHIDKAEAAIAGLQENARLSGRELQELIAEAQALRDELQIMSESGDSLASRLERLAGQAKNAGVSASQVRQTQKGSGTKQPLSPSGPDNSPNNAKSVNPAAGAFSIRDRDFDAGTPSSEDSASESMDKDGMFPGEGQDDDLMKNLHTEAERDLYEALMKNKKTEKADSA